MVGRRDLKSTHEDAVIRGFIEHLKARGSLVKIIGKPEPPDAIVDIDGKKTWIEVTDAFLDQAHAIGLTSGASDDVTHRSDSRRLIIDPDDTFRESLLTVIDKKYSKASIQAVARANGPGILLVGIFTPFNTATGIASEEQCSIGNLAKKNSIQVFSQIYVYDGTGNRTFLLVYQNA
jgi:hypothetical protein